MQYPQTKSMPTPCEAIAVMPQYTGTCWFNALLMVLLYSEGGRNLLLTREHLWKLPQPLLGILRDILKEKSRDSDHQYYYNRITPEYILQLLRKVDPRRFYFDTGRLEGHFAYPYIGHLFELLGVPKTLHLSAVYNKYTKNFDLYLNNIHNEEIPFYTSTYLLHIPRVLKMLTSWFTHQVSPTQMEHAFDAICIEFLQMDAGLEQVNTRDQYVKGNTYFPRLVKRGLSKKDLLTEKLFLGNNTYRIDSAFFVNIHDNKATSAHAIAGITCGDRRFIYNGWTRDRGQFPCPLFPFDWVNRNDYYVLPDQNVCGFDVGLTKRTGLKYNSHTNEAVFVYVHEQFYPNSEKKSYCEAQTSKGSRCKLRASDTEEYCAVHRRQREDLLRKSKSYHDDPKHLKTPKILLELSKVLFTRLDNYVINMSDSMAKRTIVYFIENWAMYLSAFTVAMAANHRRILKKIHPRDREKVEDLMVSFYGVVMFIFGVRAIVQTKVLMRPQKIEQKRSYQDDSPSIDTKDPLNVLGVYFFFRSILPALVDTQALPKMPSLPRFQIVRKPASSTSFIGKLLGGKIALEFQHDDKFWGYVDSVNRDKDLVQNVIQPGLEKFQGLFDQTK